MRTITLDEIQYRGFSHLDHDLKEGPVHITQNKHRRYVILTEGQYKEMLADGEEAYRLRIKKSLEDLKSGRFKKGSVEDLIKDLGLED